jgi:hypothetical protein
MVSGEAYERYQTGRPSFGSTAIPTAFPSSASTHSTALHPEIVDSDLLAALGHQRDGRTHMLPGIVRHDHPEGFEHVGRPTSAKLTLK